MAFRDFETPHLSRRSLLRSGALLGAGAALGGWPLGRAAFAQAATQWPNVAKLANEYVSARKVANIVAALGFDQAAPEVVAAGTLAFGDGTAADIEIHRERTRMNLVHVCLHEPMHRTDRVDRRLGLT